MTAPRKLTIGVLAIQGGFIEHSHALRQCDAVERVVEFTNAKEMAAQPLDGIVLPGGESSAMAVLLESFDLLEPLRAYVRAGKAVWGTCAGMILLSDSIKHAKLGGQSLVGGLHATTVRNAFGRQKESFIATLDVPDVVLADREKPFRAVFIRAPIIESVGDDVRVLARVVRPSAPPDAEPDIVAVRQDRILATSFHPELTRDIRFHEYFCRMVAGEV